MNLDLSIPYITLFNTSQMTALTLTCSLIPITYTAGAKVQDFTVQASEVQPAELDNSGFMRWLIFQASNSMILIPDDVPNQKTWADNVGFQHSSKDDYKSCGLNDGHVRLCFSLPNKQYDPGHVWICYNGKTFECAIGEGVISRDWNTPLLSESVSDIYIIF